MDIETRTSSRAGTAIGLTCALVVPLLHAFVGGPHLLAETTPAARTLVGYGMLWRLAGTLLAIILVVERRPLSTMGVRRPSWRLLVVAVVVGWC